MKFAREGLIFIAIAMVLAVASVVWAMGQASWPFWLLAALLVVIALWTAYFFRDPERAGDRGDRLVIAPADGKLVMIAEVDEPSFLHGRATRVSIFMNVFNVHVNRYPASGTVEYRAYVAGHFGHAGTEKASLENEQSTVGLVTARGKLLVRQIAGLVARRIVTDHQPGTAVTQAARMGLIRFGSRVDVFVPASARVLVRTGEKTLAGHTVIAQWD